MSALLAYSQQNSPQEKTTTQNAKTQTAQAEESQTLKDLFARNPFGKTKVEANINKVETAEVQAPKGLELRSIYCVSKKWYFSIFDSSLKKTYTVKLGDKTSPDQPYAVDFYDEETNSISVSSNLSAFVLTLKTPDAPTGANIAPSTSTPTQKTKPLNKNVKL